MKSHTLNSVTAFKALWWHSHKNVVCYRKDKPAGAQFLPSPGCEYDKRNFHFRVMVGLKTECMAQQAEVIQPQFRIPEFPSELMKYLPESVLWPFIATLLRVQGDFWLTLINFDLIWLTQNVYSEQTEPYNQCHGVKVVLEGCCRCPDSHDLSAYHHLYDLCRHI